MANKYIIEGATYNGDGTTSAEAASAGAAGAWNHIDILTGTAVGYGSIAAGDTIYIRSKSSAGADLTITAGAAVTFGSTAGTAAAPITWVLDGGSKWSGINGTLSLETTGQYTFTSANTYNVYAAQNHEKWVLKTTAAPNVGTNPLLARGCFINWLIDFSLSTDNSRGANIISSGNSIVTIFKNCRFISHQRVDGGALITTGSANRVVMDNCIIELIASESVQIFNSIGNSILEMIGGEIKGTGATSVTSLTKAANLGCIKTVGTKIPFELKLNTGNPTIPSWVECVGADDTVGARSGYWWGELSSRTDGYYPTLNAVLTDSVSSPWSWWMYPSAATAAAPGDLTSTVLYSATADTADISLEFLSYTGFTAVNAGTVYAVISYVDDTTGEVVTLTTKDTANGALTTSTADWSSSTYGPANFNKYKLVATTPSTIKQNSLITVTLTCEAKSINPTDVLIIDPSVQVV